MAWQVAKGIRDPSSGMLGQASFDQVLQQWSDQGQSLSADQQSSVASECTHLMRDQSQAGSKALQHKYRTAAHAVLAADSGLADQVARVRAWYTAFCPPRTVCLRQVLSVLLMQPVLALHCTPCNAAISDVRSHNRHASIHSSLVWSQMEVLPIANPLLHVHLQYWHSHMQWIQKCSLGT